MATYRAPDFRGHRTIWFNGQENTTSAALVSFFGKARWKPTGRGGLPNPKLKPRLMLGWLLRFHQPIRKAMAASQHQVVRRAHPSQDPEVPTNQKSGLGHPQNAVACGVGGEPWSPRWVCLLMCVQDVKMPNLMVRKFLPFPSSFKANSPWSVTPPSSSPI